MAEDRRAHQPCDEAHGIDGKGLERSDPGVRVREEANERIKRARKALQQPREAIFKAMNDLLRLQATSEMPFEPGKSGNPAGKLKGTRNKTTLAVEALLDGEAETITRKAIELAKDGDLTALRLCLDRIAPPRKDRPVLFELPPVSSAADAAKAAAALLEAVAVGDLTPAEASELGKLIEAYIKALEATDFAERLDKLERMTNR
jgi:hypothetical protein